VDAWAAANYYYWRSLHALAYLWFNSVFSCSQCNGLPSAGTLQTIARKAPQS
jgi:hypothetical protein